MASEDHKPNETHKLIEDELLLKLEPLFNKKLLALVKSNTYV